MAHSEAAFPGDFEAISFVRSVCLRPTMYTLGGSFAEVVCFLEGLFSAEARVSRPCPQAEDWSNLSDRLRRELADGTEGGGWQSGFLALRRRCPDDRGALDLLAEIYDSTEARA